MDRYNKLPCMAQGPRSRTPGLMSSLAGTLLMQTLLFLLGHVMLTPMTIAAEVRQTVAVLPFKINARAPLDHLRLGLQKHSPHDWKKRGFR